MAVHVFAVQDKAVVLPLRPSPRPRTELQRQRTAAHPRHPRLRVYLADPAHRSVHVAPRRHGRPRPLPRGDVGLRTAEVPLQRIGRQQASHRFRHDCGRAPLCRPRVRMPITSQNPSTPRARARPGGECCIFFLTALAVVGRAGGGVRRDVRRQWAFPGDRPECVCLARCRGPDTLATPWCGARPPRGWSRPYRCARQATMPSHSWTCSRSWRNSSMSVAKAPV